MKKLQPPNNQIRRDAWDCGEIFGLFWTNQRGDSAHCIPTPWKCRAVFAGDLHNCVCVRERERKGFDVAADNLGRYLSPIVLVECYCSIGWFVSFLLLFFVHHFFFLSLSLMHCFNGRIATVGMASSPESPQSPSGSEPFTLEKKLGDFGIDESPVTPTPLGPGNPLGVSNGEKRSGRYFGHDAMQSTHVYVMLIR